MEQVQGLWKVKNQNMSDLYEVAKNLKNKFVSFEINHVLRVGTVDFALVLMLYVSSALYSRYCKQNTDGMLLNLSPHFPSQKNRIIYK